MADTAIEMEKKGFEFLFAFEVEIGFLVGNLSYDKDGVRTAAIFTEMTDYLLKSGTTLSKHLDKLREK